MVSQNESDPLEVKQEDFSKYKDELPVWSILPSYSMFQGLLFNPQRNNDELQEPPNYLASLDTASSSVDNMSSVSSTIGGLDHVESHTSSDNTVYFDDNTTQWQSTILDNVDLLRDMSNTDNKYASAISIEIKFTKDVCQVGVAPELIDPSNFEYKQGDFINGYILIENSSEETIQFEMFYLIFEGRLRQNPSSRPKDPIQRKRFLEMFDFSGSYNYASINRLVTDEYESPGVCSENATDPYDNTYLNFPQRFIKPQRMYKRFFSFKIPEKLLDSQCSSYNLSTHVNLPPSVGGDSDVKDFAFNKTAIEYGVTARFIGKGTNYKFKMDDQEDAKVFNRKGVEYVILKDAMKCIRVVQLHKPLKLNHKTFITLMHSNLLQRIEEKIKLGESLCKMLKDDNLENVSKLVEQVEQQIKKEGSDEIKLNQLYVSSTSKKQPRQEMYEMIHEFGGKKFGLLKTTHPYFVKVTTPKLVYEFKYISPKRFRKEDVDLSKYDLKIPVNMSLLASTETKLPTIKNIICDFVCLSLFFDKHPIPIEFNHDMIFSNKPKPTKASSIYKDQDNFSTNVRGIFKEKAQKIYDLSKQIDLNNLKVERSLISDLSALANLKDKCNNLSIRNVKFEQNDMPCSAKNLTWSKGNVEYTNNFFIKLNLKDLQLKTVDGKPSGNAFDEFTLVPDFQSCFMARFYYIRVFISLSNNHVIDFKVPISIVN